jgi:hypothetical protein
MDPIQSVRMGILFLSLNVLLLTYESMVSDPIQSVRRLAAHMRLQLTESEVCKCAERMDKKWALVCVCVCVCLFREREIT